MSLSIKGYVLEPPRVGASNSPYTFTPNTFVSDSAAFNAYYTSAENVSRTDYCVLTQIDGLLVNAAFGWTKNDGETNKNVLVRRFDYDARVGCFRPLPGGAMEEVGTLTTGANTTRLKVTPPIGILPSAPFRLSVGTGSGTTFTVSLVATDAAFTTITTGQSVEVSLSTGNVNWKTSDLTAYAGQPVRWQRQSFLDFTESGRVGLPTDANLFLNPIPGPGQYPLIRFGFGFYLTPVYVATEGGFSPNPVAGSVEWAGNTGRLKFNSSDVSANATRPVYYDGVLLGWKKTLTPVSVGTVSSPTPLPSPPTRGGDVIFRLPSGYQFPSVLRLATTDSFDPTGEVGQVQLKDDGSLQFSFWDQSNYGATPVTAYVADLPIDRGVSMRFFRSVVNLDGSDPSVKDTTNLYSVTGATWADPIIQSPFVALPITPVQDNAYPLHVYVEQGTGSFVGDLDDLDTLPSSTQLGYYLDYEQRRLYYARRKSDQLSTFSQAGSTLQLPDLPVRLEGLTLQVETGPGTNNYQSLSIGSTALVDPNAATVTLINPVGSLIAQGTAGSSSGTTLTDGSQDFVAAGVVPGNTLVIPSGVASGVYTITVVTSTVLTTDVAIPSAASVAYEVRTAAEVLADRYFQEVTPLDPNTKVKRIRKLGAAQNDTLVYTSTAAGSFPTSTTLYDSSVNFLGLSNPVMAGDTIKLTTGPDAGSYRTVTIVEENTLTVDQPFSSFSAANYEIHRRLHIPAALVGASEVRLNTSFATLVHKADNTLFSNPATLAAGTVEISDSTGDLNLSSADVTAGSLVYWSLTLRYPTDFRVSRDLGFVELTERLLAYDEVYITYKPVTLDGITSDPITEHVGFLVRKELTQPWPRPAVTDLVKFNPTGRTVSSAIQPSVFRGGRPQDDTQILVNLTASTITFLPNTGYMTDALPSGSALQTDERVLVDYYVYEAMGGERSFNVLQPPIYAAQVTLALGATSFTLMGDQTAYFPADYLLRVEKEQVYLIGSSSYSATTGLTTVTLAYGAKFQDDFINPKLYLSSGVIRLNPVFPEPSYFQTEMNPFGSIPRGSNRFTLPGDRQLVYQTGTAVLFTDNATYYDLYLVSGAAFKDGVTEVILQQNVRRQYEDSPSLLSPTVLKRSIRPILEDGVTQTQTQNIPLLSQPVIVYRRVDGQPGVVQQEGSQYTLDASGVFRYTPALQPNESLSIYYTSYRVAPQGTRIKSSYTTMVVPDASNGLLGQVLRADFLTHVSDSFYYRVETLTNFQAEYMAALQASAYASVPSFGPVTSNLTSPKLYQQGRESLFFTEGHTANGDYVGRQFLKFYNDNANKLEDVLQNYDGRVVGDVNGRFRFDGKTDNPVRTSYTDVTNEIDDLYRVSLAPWTLTSWFPPTYTSVGTYKRGYQSSNVSRLYPMLKKNIATIAQFGEGTPGIQSGDLVASLGVSPLASTGPLAYTRLARGLVTQQAEIGDTSIVVDNAAGTPDFIRPGFKAGMRLAILNPSGVNLLPAYLTVSADSLPAENPPVVKLTSGVPVVIPVGSTVVVDRAEDSKRATPYAKTYRSGFDFSVDYEAGNLGYIEPWWPFSSSAPSILDSSLWVHPFTPNETIDMPNVGIRQQSTAPFKFPALYGGVASDSGDQSIPVMSPTFTQEMDANRREFTILSTAQAHVSPEVGVGGATLDGTGTVITAPGFWPFPTPQVYDLVRFVTGSAANVAAGWRRISVVGGSTVTVDTAFPDPGVGGDIVLTATTNVHTGNATITAVDTFTDATLTSSVVVGQTVVFTSGPNAGIRAQILEVSTPPGTVKINYNLPSMVLSPYRVSDSVRTYSGWFDPGHPFTNTPSLVQTQRNVLDLNTASPTQVDCVRVAITKFFDGSPSTEGVLTDLVSSSNGTLAGTTLTDSTVNFTTAGVNTTHLVYIESGANGQFYPIQSVDSATQITITSPWPSPASGVSYRIVKVFGVGAQTLQSLFTARKEAVDWSASSLTWYNTVTDIQPVTVSPIDFVFASAVNYSDLLARVSALSSRYTKVQTGSLGSPSTISNVEAALKSRDKLYDKRYSWINARTNVQTGSLYVIERAVADRQAATAKLYDTLLQLLSLESV